MGILVCCILKIISCYNFPGGQVGRSIFFREFLKNLGQDFLRGCLRKFTRTLMEIFGNTYADFAA
jgi:hypothetical protein